MFASNDIRKLFLSYFEKQGHRIIPSSSLIPFADPTLLFTNAGMNQFKDVFLGKEERPYNRAVSSQKCMRVSGKHNDFREVGHSNRHHTFFEMLGNFSFGNYFKREAIRLAWELVTREFGLDSKRLWITVYRDDDEAWQIWNRDIGVAPERIFRLGEEDNFWAMGETGPCGPCSELHYDFGRSPIPGHGQCDLTCTCGRWVEIWNLVFMQFNRDAAGTTKPLPSPSIDTGMGFERIAAVLQGKTSNYETDIFLPLLTEIARIAATEYGLGTASDASMRIIADHARAAAFVIGDGQYPGNDKRGYVLRKIMRRAIVHGKKLGIEEPFFFRVAGVVGEQMQNAYPELSAARDAIARAIQQEEVSFADTLAQGLRDFEERSQKLLREGVATVPGRQAFFLYDTRGLPLEIIEDLAQEKGLLVDEAGFNRALEEQRERSRRDYESGKVREEVAGASFEGTTQFVGYDYTHPVPCRVQAILVDGSATEVLPAGQSGKVILDATPFYPEAGGQVGDTGVLSSEHSRARVHGTQYLGTAITHLVEVETGRLEVGGEVMAEVDMGRRQQTARNHTATHLLHAALKSVLGPHVKQAGSLVAPDRLRFDFTHFAPLTPAELRKIEDEINAQVWLNSPVETASMDLDEALNSGAEALFGEKYRERVRVVQVAGYSRELCGGTHLAATGSIGIFKVVSEVGIAAGVRRLEALTGPAALDRFREAEQILDYLQSEHKVSRQDLPALVQKLQLQVRDLEKRTAEIALDSMRQGIDRMLSRTRKIHDIPMIAEVVTNTDRAGMRILADEIKQRLGSGIVVLGSIQDEKAALVAMVTSNLAKRIPAGRILKEIAAIVGGSGGGKPELAEAGGKDFARLADAMEESFSVVERLLANK